MEQSRGREKAKHYVVLFIIGVFLTFITTVITEIGERVEGLSWLSFFIFAALVGSILQIIAIVKLRNVNKSYANALWALILNFLIILVVTILGVIAAFQDGNESLEVASDWLLVAAEFAEALVVVHFVIGTNKLAEENEKGMPILTKIIVIGYMAIFVIALLLNILSMIVPAIKENTIVLGVFGTIILVLYAVREVAYIFFLIRALWRVK
ncbi:MAG: hypothetical protein J5880_01100 [Bacilli bacterium]|nr:hypothetical protein [Bacilli bacterium]